VGILWGLLDEAGEQVRRHLVLTSLERAPVGVPASPAGVVASGDAHVRMPELAAHVAELNPGREKLGRKRVPQVLRRVRTSRAVSLHGGADPGGLADFPKVALPVVRVVQRGDWPLFGSALLELETQQRAPKPP
jgi:hypothetical protein